MDYAFGDGQASPVSSAPDIVQHTLNELNTLRPQRQVWDGHWQDIKELVRCDTTDFNRKTVQGYRRYDLVYDGTAINANEELASGLHSYLTSPVDRWFELQVEDQAKLKNDPSCLEWLEQVSDIIYDVFADPRVNFNPSLHECYLDLGSFGTCVLNEEWDVDERHIIFRNVPLAENYFIQNSRGIVDNNLRYFQWTSRQIEQSFDGLPPLVAKQVEKNPHKQFNIIHHVYPNDQFRGSSLLSKDKKWKSVWICETTKELFEEKGYDDFPYHISRWVKLGGETYGRGPAMKCLPDIKSLQAMEKVLLKAGQKAVDPPLIVPDDGFMLPIKTSPGSVNYKDTTDPNAKIEWLEFAGDVKFGLEQTQQKRDYIEKCFYSEWLKMEKDNKEMTAYETADRRDEKLRLMAPMLGRQQTELLGPIIHRTYDILNRRGMIPPCPPRLRGMKLKLVHVSPAARAQQGVKADRMARFFQDVVPLAQVNPDVMDVVDLDKATQVYAMVRGVPRLVLRSPQELAQFRQKKQMQQDAAQAAQTAEPASKAVLNLAQAGKASGGGAPGGPV